MYSEAVFPGEAPAAVCHVTNQLTREATKYDCVVSECAGCTQCVMLACFNCEMYIGCVTLTDVFVIKYHQPVRCVLRRYFR